MGFFEVMVVPQGGNMVGDQGLATEFPHSQGFGFRV